MFRKVVLTFFAITLAGCVGTKAGAYRVFAEDLERLSGKTFEESYVYNIGYLAKLQPDSVKELSNGNKIMVFSVKQPRKQRCSVHIETNQNNIVVAATSKGPECWRAY